MGHGSAIAKREGDRAMGRALGRFFVAMGAGMAVWTPALMWGLAHRDTARLILASVPGLFLMAFGIALWANAVRV